MEDTKITDISSMTVSASVLSKIIGVSERRVRQLAEEGVLVRAAKGRYKFEDSIKNYILTLKFTEQINNEISINELDLEKEKAIHEKVKRNISELKLATMRGFLHEADDVERVMDDMLVSFRTRLLNIPSKLAPMLVAIDNVGVVKDKLYKEVVEVLNELKDYNPIDFQNNDFLGDETDEEYEQTERA